MAILQKGMPVQFTSGQDSSRYPYVQLSTGDDARVVPVRPVAGDAKRATTFQIQSSGDSTRVPKIQIQGPPTTNMAAWFVYGGGITVTGSGVSQWDDQSGNARHLLQGTDTNRPALQADGSILFDGVDNFMSTGVFTLNQPATVYLLGKQITWTSADVIWNSAGGARLVQAPTTPSLRVNAGSGVADNNNWTLDTYAVVATVVNGASSLIQVNNTTPTTGNAGASNFGGFTVGGAAAGANFQVKEIIVYSAAHDAATRSQVINYLARVGGLSI